MSTTIYVSSLPGIHQNSNVSTGGGTDDTAVIQTALDAGPFPLILVQDGASLVTGLNISSNTTIQCSNSSCGFYLANASNRSIFRNVNRSGSVITDHDIIFDSGTYNQNMANQSGRQEPDGTPMATLQFYGIKNFEVKNLTVLNTSYAGVGFGNFNNVNIHDCTFTAADVTTLEISGVDVRGPGITATMKNLVIKCGDDSIALNARDYRTIVNVGPYLLGGTITDVVISGIVFQNCWSGIDIIPDGAHSYTVNDVYISNLSGTVQNFALYLNRDLFNSPSALGTCRNIYVSGSTVTVSGSPGPYGAPIPVGLWLIDCTATDIQFSNIVPSQPVFIPTVNGAATSLVLSGVQRGPAIGIASFTTSQSGYMQGAVAALASSVANLSTAFPANVTAGNVLVVFSFGYVAGGATISSITDTVGTSLTWTSQGTFTDGATGHVGEVWTAIASATEAHTVKVTYSGTMTAIGSEVAEYGASAVDNKSSLGLSASLATITCPSVTVPGGHTDSVLGIGTGNQTNTAAVAPSILRQYTNPNLSLIEDSVQGAGNYTPSWTQTAASSYNMSMALLNNPAQTTYSIMGYVGLAGVTVSCSGGSATSDAFGNFVISGLANGAYTITPSLAGYTFSPTNSAQTISSADINGVNFTTISSATAYSVPDCRVAPFGPNSSRTVQGTKIYDVQTSDNSAIPPTDSRAAGAPADSRISPNIPLNSRAPGTFGPGE